MSHTAPKTEKTQHFRPVFFSSLAFESVYGAGDPRKCPGKQTTKEIAEIIITAGVTPKSIILVWHKSTMDIDLLREHLESAGYFDILPPNENCILMIRHFRAGLQPCV